MIFDHGATAKIDSLSLHDALPISASDTCSGATVVNDGDSTQAGACANDYAVTRSWHAVDACGNSSGRSEEHTSELQSLRHLVCRLLLETTNECPLTPSFQPPTASD